MGRFNSELYDKVYPRPTKAKVVESAVKHFKETETEVEEDVAIETEVDEVETEETEETEETKETEQEVE